MLINNQPGIAILFHVILIIFSKNICYMYMKTWNDIQMIGKVSAIHPLILFFIEISIIYGGPDWPPLKLCMYLKFEI